MEGLTAQTFKSTTAAYHRHVRYDDDVVTIVITYPLRADLLDGRKIILYLTIRIAKQLGDNPYQPHIRDMLAEGSRWTRNRWVRGSRCQVTRVGSGIGRWTGIKLDRVRIQARDELRRDGGHVQKTFAEHANEHGDLLVQFTFPSIT